MIIVSIFGVIVFSFLTEKKKLYGLKVTILLRTHESRFNAVFYWCILSKLGLKLNEKNRLKQYTPPN